MFPSQTYTATSNALRRKSRPPFCDLPITGLPGAEAGQAQSRSVADPKAICTGERGAARSGSRALAYRRRSDRPVLSYSPNEMEVTPLTSSCRIHAEIDDHTHRSNA